MFWRRSANPQIAPQRFYDLEQVVVELQERVRKYEAELDMWTRAQAVSAYLDSIENKAVEISNEKKENTKQLKKPRKRK